MKLARFSTRRLWAALAIGLLVEALLLAALIAAINVLPDGIGEPLGDLLQAPGSYLVAWLGKVQHPGFEEQVGYVLLVPVVQWMFISIVAYLWLSKRAAARALLTPRTSRAGYSK